MPANRSRTVQWRRCLEQIHQRGGAVELAVARDYREDEAGSHLIWRIRLLHMDASELIVEQPMALGRLIPVEPGAELVVIIAIGQNRWMFSTTNLGTVEHPDGVRPHVMGELVSLGDASGRLLLRWRATVPFHDAFPQPATLWTGSGARGVPRGLLLGSTTIPPGPGPHVLALEVPPGGLEPRALVVRVREATATEESP